MKARVLGFIRNQLEYCLKKIVPNSTQGKAVVFVSGLENNPEVAYQIKECYNLFLMKLFSKCTENHCLALTGMLSN